MTGGQGTHILGKTGNTSIDVGSAEAEAEAEAGIAVGLSTSG